MRALLLAGAVVTALAAATARGADTAPPDAATVATAGACLAKQQRRQRGAEAQRASALQAHFRCYPADAGLWMALFGTGAPLAAEAEAHLELLHAARPLVGERAWCPVAVGILAGGAPDAVRRLHAGLLAEGRAACVLDVLARHEAAARAAAWAVMGDAARMRLCAGRDAPACRD